VSVGAARELFLGTILVRVCARLGIAGLVLFGAGSGLESAVANGDTRTLSFHHVHTGEDITITYKRSGRYDEAALKKLDWFMRDWRKEQETHMDPHLFDLLWEVYRETGATQPIDVICGYRSPGTNAMLRARSTGVAQFSQHINGQAMDFYIPGVPLRKIMEVGLRLQRGGVGFYPTSGSPFVHMDTGSIRHWPRIPREELAKIFPNGRTVHIPADGTPLPGYALALADVERQGHAPSGTSLEQARAAGVITPTQEAQAEHPQRGLLARLFGTGKADNTKADDEHGEQPAPRHARAPMAVASLTPPPSRVATERIVPLPTVRPRMVARPRSLPVEVASAIPMPIPAQRTYVTASLPDNAAGMRGTVSAAPLTPARASPFDVAALDPATTGSTADAALAYAPVSDERNAARVRPMGRHLPRMPAEATVIPASSNSSVVVKPPLASALAGGGQRSDSPWLRAALLTPSVARFMTTTQFGATDPRWERALLDKPSVSVAMSFSADPHLGMVANRFSGRAVVFVDTATFKTQATASLR
jgi:uncharacterized protein YcbK (DUF882 family)